MTVNVIIIHPVVLERQTFVEDQIIRKVCPDGGARRKSEEVVTVMGVHPLGDMNVLGQLL